MQSKLLEKEEEITDLRKRVTELTYAIDNYKRKEWAEKAGLTIAQRQTLHIEGEVLAAD